MEESAYRELPEEVRYGIDVLSWLEDILNEKEEERKINGILLDSLSAGPIPDQLSIAAVSQMWPGPNPPSQIKRNFGTQFVFEFKQDGVKVKKTVYLVNNTMPVNFMFYGTPIEIMDMTYSQVTSCAVALIKNQDIAPGIYPTDYKRSATEGVYDGIIPEKAYEAAKGTGMGDAWKRLCLKISAIARKRIVNKSVQCYN